MIYGFVTVIHYQRNLTLNLDQTCALNQGIEEL